MSATYTPSSFKIHGLAMSTCTQRGIITALENGILPEVLPVDLFKGAHKQPEFLAKQPFGKIPLLEEKNGFVLWESRAIAQYIDETYGGALTPKDQQARALMNQWCQAEVNAITPPVSTIVYQRIFAPMFGSQPDEEVIKAKVVEANAALDVLDAQLAKNEFVAGSQFTLADVFLMPYFAMVLGTPEKSLIENHANVNKWFTKVTARPSWIKAMELKAASL